MSANISDDEEPKMSRLLKLAQKFNCFYLNGKYTRARKEIMCLRKKALQISSHPSSESECDCIKSIAMWGQMAKLWVNNIPPLKCEF